MSAAALGLVITVGALLLFALISVIIINRSLKQQKKMIKSTFLGFLSFGELSSYSYLNASTGSNLAAFRAG